MTYSKLSSAISIKPLDLLHQLLKANFFYVSVPRVYRGKEDACFIQGCGFGFVFEKRLDPVPVRTSRFKILLKSIFLAVFIGQRYDGYSINISIILTFMSTEKS